MSQPPDDAVPGCSKDPDPPFRNQATSKDEIFQCSICKTMFDTQEPAMQHFQQCSKPQQQNMITKIPISRTMKPISMTRGGKRFELEVLACQTCTFWSLREDKMHAHIVEAHDGAGAYTYKNALYINPPSILKKTAPPKPQAPPEKAFFSCDKCLYKTTNYHQFRNHLHAQPTRSDLELYQCLFCSFACSVEDEMDTHAKEAHSILESIPVMPLDFRCTPCRKIFTDYDSLEEHKPKCPMSVEDQIQKNYPHEQCTDCSFGTNAKQLMEFHRHLMHNNHSCNDCEELFNSKRELNAHVQEKHAHRCNRCHIGFATRRLFLEHEQEKHPLPHICDLCGLRFGEEDELMSHLAAHTATMCSSCEQTYSTVQELKAHMMEVHPKNNMLGKNVCTGCFHVFSTATALSKHYEDCPVVAGLCVQCGDACGSIDTLLEHVTNNHKEMEIHSCEACGYKTIDATVHMNHLMIHMPLPPTSGSSRYQCDICEKWTASAGSLRTHVNNHNKLKPYRCEFCEFVTSSGGNLRAHRAVRHLSTPQAIKCAICNRRYRTVGQMNKHVKKTHNQELNHQCEHCGNRFVSATRLKRHLAVVHFEDTEAVTGKESYAGLTRFRCEDCPYNSYSANRFRLHKATHRDKLKCPHCDLNFPLVDVLNRHINLRHLKKQVHCQYCHRRLPDEARLNHHIEACHVEGIPEIRCDECGYCFESLAHYEYHQRSHLTVKKFECSTCKRCFTTAASLCVHRLRHKKLDVNRGRMFMGNSNWVFCCDTCRLRFKYKSSLLAHQSAVHSESEDLCCQYCSRGPFSSKLLLGYHIRKHLQERAFACDYCPKRFFTSSSLNSHTISVHTKAYKIFCTLCKKGMLTQLRLRLHMMHAHKEKPTKRKARHTKTKTRITFLPQLIDDSIILDAGPDDLIAADENILNQEIVISTIEESCDEVSDPNADFISIFDASCVDSPHLVQITVGTDGDQIGEVEFGEYVIE